MARLNELGNVIVRCWYCGGGLTTYEWQTAKGGEHGVIEVKEGAGWRGWVRADVHFRLFRCAGCGHGGLGAVSVEPRSSYRDGNKKLLFFKPEAGPSLPIPDSVPDDLRKEFREAEECLSSGCYRAASVLFRSTLEKTFRAAGYKLKKNTSLREMVDLAAGDGVITESRSLRAHQEVRVLGNDVLHDEWQLLTEDDVSLAHHYTQRVLEDLYDDRPAVVALLHKKERQPLEALSEESEGQQVQEGATEVDS